MWLGRTAKFTVIESQFKETQWCLMQILMPDFFSHSHEHCSQSQLTSMNIAIINAIQLANWLDEQSIELLVRLSAVFLQLSQTSQPVSATPFLALSPRPPLKCYTPHFLGAIHHRVGPFAVQEIICVFSSHLPPDPGESAGPHSPALAAPLSGIRCWCVSHADPGDVVMLTFPFALAIFLHWAFFFEHGASRLLPTRAPRILRALFIHLFV